MLLDAKQLCQTAVSLETCESSFRNTFHLTLVTLYWWFLNAILKKRWEPFLHSWALRQLRSLLTCCRHSAGCITAPSEGDSEKAVCPVVFGLPPHLLLGGHRGEYTTRLSK